jgi:hypothetical protein
MVDGWISYAYAYLLISGLLDRAGWLDALNKGQSAVLQ